MLASFPRWAKPYAQVVGLLQKPRVALASCLQLLPYEKERRMRGFLRLPACSYCGPVLLSQLVVVTDTGIPSQPVVADHGLVPKAP